jgi:hypothetical protein
MALSTSSGHRMQIGTLFTMCGILLFGGCGCQSLAATMLSYGIDTAGGADQGSPEDGRYESAGPGAAGPGAELARSQQHRERGYEDDRTRKCPSPGELGHHPYHDGRDCGSDGVHDSNEAPTREARTDLACGEPAGIRRGKSSPVADRNFASWRSENRTGDTMTSQPRAAHSASMFSPAGISIVRLANGIGRWRLRYPHYQRLRNAGNRRLTPLPMVGYKTTHIRLGGNP